MNFHKLDNVGTFFASTSIKHNPDVFRFAITMDELIDEEILKQALVQTKESFPSFNVSLKMGLFWYYLEEEEDVPEVKEESLPVCFRIDSYRDEVLYRVTYYKNRINLEVSHIISDGRGTLEFCTSLIENYVSLKYKIKVKPKFKATVLEREEDSYEKYYKKCKSPKGKKTNTYNFKGKRIKKHNMRFVEMHMNSKKVLSVSKSNNVSLTVYIVSLIIRSIIKTMSYKDAGKDIRIAVPVDLRSFYYSKTTKNFFGLVYINYKFNGEVDDLNTIITNVNEQFKESIDKDNIIKRSNQMYSLVSNVVIRSIPLILKNVGLSIIDKFTHKLNTTHVSNMGKLEFSKEVENHVKSVALMISTEDLQFVVSSFKDDLCIVASSRFMRNNVLNYLVEELQKENIDINVVSNGV